MAAKAEKNNTIPNWASGIMLGGTSIMLSQAAHIFGYTYPLPFLWGGVGVGLGLFAIDVFTGNRRMNEAFRLCGVENKDKEIPRVLHTRTLLGFDKKTAVGKTFVLAMPYGTSILDFTKENAQAALSQALGGEVTVRAGDKNTVLLDLCTTSLPKNVPFDLIKPPKPTYIPIGVTRRGVVYMDLEVYAHLLVAGIPGFGKSNFLCGLICTLGMWTRDEVCLHLCDLKEGGVEFAMFENLRNVYPGHNIRQVNKKVEGYPDELDYLELLQWLSKESESRYAKFLRVGAKKLAQYNEKVPKSERMGIHIVVIDEFGALEMFKKKNSDPKDDPFMVLKQRMQRDRAAGIHYILSTQRPSADVLPGYLKGLLGAVLAFKAMNGTNSEIVLDRCGAELLQRPGHGIYRDTAEYEVQTMDASKVTQKDILAYIVNPPIKQPVKEDISHGNAQRSVVPVFNRNL